jgi:hypothetical protein
MDLGFSRRNLIRTGAVDPAFDYRMLLAKISARQAISRTARVQAALGKTAIYCRSTCPGSERFVPQDHFGARKPQSASFYPPVADRMVAIDTSL